MIAGEKVLKEVAQLVLNSNDQRAKLREAGWERVLDPPLVGNEWIWRHPSWFVQLESEAIKLMEMEQ